MAGVLVCDSLESESVPPRPLTKEAVMSLINESVTLERARSLFDVDLQTFKAKLLEFNIFVWNDANGLPVRIHGGDYQIHIVINKIHSPFLVKGTNPFFVVKRKIENALGLTPGRYELTYKKPPTPIKTLVSRGCYIVTYEQTQTSIYNALKTDLDWHYAVEYYSKVRGRYPLRLNLEANDDHIVTIMNAYDGLCASDGEYAD